MAYNIIISSRALAEIEAAIDFYIIHSNDAPGKFIAALIEIYNSLSNNPFKRIRYKNIRAASLKKFPYSLYFVINKQKNTVRVLACFHNKRNPKNRPSL